MNRSTNFNFYLPTNADPMRISDLTYNFEEIDDNMVSVSQQTLTTAEKNQVMSNIGVTDKLNEMKAVSTGTISKNADISGGTVDSTVLRKVGNTVFASARIYSISRQATGVFFTIPVGFRPAAATLVNGYTYIDGVAYPLLASVSTNGDVGIYFSSTSTTTQVGFAGSWSVL